MPRVLKVRELIKRMQALGVEVRHGKGSELKLYRPGYHMQTIKAHGQGEDVYPFVVKIACQKLGISLEEFWKGFK